MQFSVDYKYKEYIDEFSYKYKNFTPIFDGNSILQVQFELGKREILIQSNSNYGGERYIYRYKQIKKIITYSYGLLVVFKDEKYIFLPVTDDEIADDDLLYIAKTLYEHQKIKFRIKSRLCVINYNSKNQKRKRINLSFADSPVILTVVAIVVMLVGMIFAITPSGFEPVSREECIVYTEEYVRFECDSDDIIYLYFEDGDEQWIDYSCYSKELYDNIASIKTEDKLQILLHPHNEYVVEIVCNGKEFLNLDFAQKVMYEDVKGMDIMGYVLLAIGVFAFIYAISKFVAEHSKNKTYGEEW